LPTGNEISKHTQQRHKTHSVGRSYFLENYFCFCIPVLYTFLFNQFETNTGGTHCFPCNVVHHDTYTCRCVKGTYQCYKVS